MRTLASPSSPMRRQQGAHPGLVHLDAEEAGVRLLGGDPRGGVAHAEPDLEHDRRTSAEGLLQIEGRLLERKHESRAQLVERALLARGPCGRRAARSCAQGGGGTLATWGGIVAKAHGTEVSVESVTVAKTPTN